MNDRNDERLVLFSLQPHAANIEFYKFKVYIYVNNLLIQLLPILLKTYLRQCFGNCL